MNEFFKRLREQLGAIWSKWSTPQKIIFFAVVGAAVLGIVLLVVFSSQPSMAPLLSRPITDQLELDAISTRLDEQNVTHSISADGRVMVEDETTARRMRALLFEEGLIPDDTDPWELFDVERWTQTDFERSVNLRRAITTQLELHLEALDDIDDVSVTIAFPEDEFFMEEQNPVTASVIISPKPGSDLTENRRKIESIEDLIRFAVEGLAPENITITDRRSGVKLNNFENLAEFDRLELNRRELEVKRQVERQYITQIQESLSRIFGKDRVQVSNIDIVLDYGNRTIEREEFSPIVMTSDNPTTPYDETQVQESIERSRTTFTEDYEGTAFNPEGPAGQEGQTPSAYQDLEEFPGRYSRSDVTVNNEINRTYTTEQGSPTITRVTVGVALDGVWRRVYDENGALEVNPDGSIAREYQPVDQEDIAAAIALVEHAVGYDADRGDSVTVQHIRFDRTDEHNSEDADYRRQQQVQQVVLYTLIGLASLLVVFVVFRLITREIERRRRLREEELARQHQAMREAALRSAEEEGADVAMSVEERARLEMQENAINMAREHPEDVAQLIRTWLVEE